MDFEVSSISMVQLNLPSSVSKNRRYCILKMMTNFQSSQGLIFRLSENLVISQCQHSNHLYYQLCYWKLPWFSERLWNMPRCSQLIHFLDISLCFFPSHNTGIRWTKKCPAVGLCRPPMGQSVDICLVNCKKDVYDENRKWMKGFAAELKMNPECMALWRQMLDLGSSLAAAFWVFTSPSPNIHRTHYWTCVPGKTHVWIESAHVNKVCNVTVMGVSLKCTKWNMRVRRVSWKCPTKAGCRPESHFYPSCVMAYYFGTS